MKVAWLQLTTYNIQYYDDVMKVSVGRRTEMDVMARSLRRGSGRRGKRFLLLAKVESIQNVKFLRHH